jgi:hypothetical protein
VSHSYHIPGVHAATVIELAACSQRSQRFADAARLWSHVLPLGVSGWAVFLMVE